MGPFLCTCPEIGHVTAVKRRRVSRRSKHARRLGARSYLTLGSQPPKRNSENFLQNLEVCSRGYDRRPQAESDGIDASSSGLTAFRVRSGRRACLGL